VGRLSRIVVLGTMLIAAPISSAGAETASQTKRVAADPNERVCEDVVVVGSRLAKKRFCGTRAEWEARKKADREVVEDAQRHANDPCSAVLTHTGPAAC
jgi:predicted alpha/beta hydrolase family esterase